MSSSPAVTPWPPPGGKFASTRWSVVRRAAPAEGGEGDPSSADLFCRIYWQPLYSFLRGRGHSHADAQDAVQSFLARLLSRNLLRRADRARGRLRSLLTTMLARHAAADQVRNRAAKRGGAAAHVPLDWVRPEEWGPEVFQSGSSPEDMFRRALAVRLVETALEALRRQYEKQGKAALAEALLPALEGGFADTSYAEVSARLGMAPGTARVAAFRLRRHFRACLRTTAAAALGMKEGAELDAELRGLFG